MKKIVYLDHTDALGIVYHSRILEWLEEERSIILSEWYKPITELIKNNEIFLPRQININYYRPMKLLDVIDIQTKITFPSKVKLGLEHNLFINDKRCANVSMMLVHLKNNRPCKIGDEFIEAVQRRENVLR